MSNPKFSLLLFIFILPIYFFGQSFIETVNSDTIHYQNLSITDDYLIYTQPGDTSEKKIDIEKVEGYYSNWSNKYYHKKIFKAKKYTGFLKLKSEMGDYFDFIERIFEGKINVYRSKDYVANNSQYYNYWFFEKGDSLAIVFSADKDRGNFKIVNTKFHITNQEFLEYIFADDEISLSAIREEGKRGNLLEIRQIVNDYNNRHFKDKIDSDHGIPQAEVVFFRDSRKELKENLILQVNGKNFKFDRNTKLKIEIPTIPNLVCIKNSDNDYCRLLSSSTSFTKFYKVILDKDKTGDVFIKNGLSNFYKVRLEHYEKVE
jgi:hypothetical protein